MVNGFSKWDWWNFNDYLAWVIAAGLRRFRDEGCGYHLDPKAGIHNEDDWNATLQKMIDAFEAFSSLSELKYSGQGEREKLEKVWEEGSPLFIKYFGSLWD